MASAVEFGLPAQFEGQAELIGGVRILLFQLEPNDQASFEASGFGPGAWTRRTHTIARAEQGTLGGGSTPWAEQTDDGPAPPNWRMDLGRLGPASLYIEADAIDVNGSLGAVMLPRRTVQTYADITPGVDPKQRLYLPHPFDAGDMFLQLRSAPEVRVIATGVRFMEWYNGAPDCGGETCVPGGGVSEKRAGFAPLDANASLESYAYVSVEGGGGSVAGSGSFGLAILSGPGIEVTNDGWFRMPTASIESCSDCGLDANRTLTLEGRVQLQDLRFKGNSAMHGSLSANVTSARLDEEKIQPQSLGFSTAAVGTGALALGGILIGVKVLLAGLFTRRKRDPLDHPRRRAIHDYVCLHPGATFREVAREVGLAAGTARHHLSSLKRAGLLVEHPFHASVRFFENHGKYAKTWRETSLLRDPALGLLEAWLRANPGAAQKEILDALETAHGWSRSTTQHRLSRLVEGGLAHAVPIGRRLQYHPGPGPQETGSGAAAGATRALTRPASLSPSVA